MGKKQDAAPAPDYTKVAAANERAAELSFQMGQDQLAWAKTEYASNKATTQEFMDVLLPSMKTEAAAGAADRERYQAVYQPIEDKLIQDSNEYASPARMEMEAGKAQSDVAQAFEGQRKGALAQLESFGVDPSTARAGALDRTIRVAEAAASAGAANASRTNTENIGRALRGEAINIGKGYPGNIAGAYQTAQQSGSGAVNAALQTTQSGASTMGTSTQYRALGSGSLGQWGQNVEGVGKAFAAQEQSNASSMAGIGSLVGSIAGIAMMKSDARQKTDIVRIGTANNGLPLYLFRYVGSRVPQVGVMAQDVQKVRPWAVIQGDDGFLMVDYDSALR